MYGRGWRIVPERTDALAACSTMMSRESTSEEVRGADVARDASKQSVNERLLAERENGTHILG